MASNPAIKSFLACFRHRVHTLAVPVVPELPALYAGADAGAIAAILAKLAVEKSLHGKLEDTRSQLAARVVTGLKEFRAMHVQHFRAHHRIIWPSSLRMLPLYVLGELFVHVPVASRGSAR